MSDSAIEHDQTVVRREIRSENPVTGRRFEGLAFTGPGRSVVRMIADETGTNRIAVVEEIVKRLLVKKGVDWTHVILGEYLSLYEDSAGTFALVWDKQARQLVAHGAVFQSAANPAAALVAHIRTAEGWNGLGFGTLVTEEVTRAAFQRGAEFVCLATDDKRHRLRQGERGARHLYAKMGYAILAEKELADTVDWLLVIDRQIFALQQAAKQAGGGRFPPDVSVEIQALQTKLVADTRSRFGSALAGGRIHPVGDGDLAGLFLLMNLCPPDDFQLKLSAWGIQLGPEFERAYVVNLRPAIADRDRLEDASLILRDSRGTAVAVCAARQAAPFTRHTFDLDFYCLPRFLETNGERIAELLDATLMRIKESPARPRPCRAVFSGIDEAKKKLFLARGFAPTGNTTPYFAPDGQAAFSTEEYERRLD